MLVDIPQEPFLDDFGELLPLISTLRLPAEGAHSARALLLVSPALSRPVCSWCPKVCIMALMGVPCCSAPSGALKHILIITLSCPQSLALPSIA